MSRNLLKSVTTLDVRVGGGLEKLVLFYKKERRICKKKPQIFTDVKMSEKVILREQ